MLHTKFQGHRFIALEKRVFTIYGHDGHLGHVTQLFLSVFIHISRNLILNDLSVSEKNKFNFEI